MLQLNFKKQRPKDGPRERSLAELHAGEEGHIDRLELGEDMAQRLMELGFLPGAHVAVARSAPGGDPRIYRIDGAEIALRRETAAHLYIRPQNP